MSGTKHRSGAVHWLQVCAASAGMGVALLAVPGVALADDGSAPSGSPGSTGTAHSRTATGQSTAKATRATQGARRVSSSPVRHYNSPITSGARRATGEATSAAPEQSATTDRPVDAPPAFKRSTAALRPAVARSSASVIAVPVLSAAAAASTPATSLAGGLSQFLTNAATWLGGLPANPITELLQGAVYLVRRTFFPSTVGVITAPIKVPLQQEQVCFAGTDSSGACKGPTFQRLGIYVSLGGGDATPQLFEFDTGSAGFYAAYASEDPAASPWWGSDFTAGGDVTKSFDSGTVYTGNAATTIVSFYDSSAATTPLLTTGRLEVGQMDDIKVGDKVWTPTGAVDGAPIDGVFYGDFGVGPTYEANGISSLLNELTFADGVLPGYRVSVDPTGAAWLQIGLTDADLNGMAFPMVLDTAAAGNVTAPNSGTRYYAQQLFLATVNIVDSAGNSLIPYAQVGITPDTGADTTLHNTDRSSQSGAIAYAGITTDQGHLDSGLDFFLSGTTTTGSPVTYFNFVTGTLPDPPTLDTLEVNVQNGNSNKEVYYLNSGIQLFDLYDVVYNMGDASGNGTVVLIPKSGA